MSLERNSITRPSISSGQIRNLLSRRQSKKIKSELSFFALHIPIEGGQAEITGFCSAGRLKFLSDRRSEPQLIAYVSISDDLKKRTVDNDIQLRCIVSEGSWAIKGDIVQNLQPDKPDCWKSGPPPKASDQELIE